ncbi:MAG: hypothetical protein ACREVN_04010 [Gammaproteobacteria bacterium]
MPDADRSDRQMRNLKPNRVTRTYRQSLHAPAERVFPLLCPVRELDWAVGWSPRLVVSSSGLAERDCVFMTLERSTEAIWYITRHEPEKLFVEMLKLTPGITACRLQIQLHPQADGCAADVTYSHTSLGPQGDEFVDNFTAGHYRHFMRQWEKELNHYLATGESLSEGDG